MLRRGSGRLSPEIVEVEPEIVEIEPRSEARSEGVVEVHAVSMGATDASQTQLVLHSQRHSADEV